MSAVEAERRAAMRAHEEELAGERLRLEDRAKEERLAQVAIVEECYQHQLRVCSLPPTR